MQMLKQAHEFEYRDHRGTDRLCRADVWQSRDGALAVLVLRGLPSQGLGKQARSALGYLSHAWLPYVVPHSSLWVWALRPESAALPKRRALVLSPAHDVA